jgi:uncharacterized protein (TIGR02147 family)
VDPSTLSKILSGQRKLGPRAQINLLQKLGFNFEFEKDFFSQISDLDFEEIPEWYDTAILEQLRVTGFKATQKTLSQVFDLSEQQIESALQRLKKLKMIEISKSGIVRDLTSGQTTNIASPTTTLAKRRLQRQFLEKAIRSIDQDPLDLRDMSTITCAIDPEKIPEAKEKIKQFRRELANFLTPGRKSKRVFNVTFALYPISKDYKEKLK